MGGYQAAAAFRLLELREGGVWGWVFYGGRQRAEGTSPALRATSPLGFQAGAGRRRVLRLRGFLLRHVQLLAGLLGGNQGVDRLLYPME